MPHQNQQQGVPPQYEYKVLTDILEGPIPTECNLYAVIVECSVPRPTRGKDWVCNARLVDPSTLGHPHLQEGVEVLMFGASPDLLPNPDSVGDIIRIHRLVVQEYLNKPQLKATIGPRKKCQYCLFHGRGVEGEPTLPYRSSTPGFTMGDREENLIQLLRNAMNLIHSSVETGPPSKYLRQIRELDPRNMFTENADGFMERNTFFDICCKVLHVQGEGNMKILYVWDGSDAPPFPIRADTRHDFADDQKVKPDEVEHEELLQFTPVDLPLQECGDVPRLGTAMPVRMYGLGGLQREVPLPQPGAWVKLRNVAACIICGQLQGLFRKSSKWSPWSPSQDALHALDRREEDGIIQEWAPENRQELLASSSGLCTEKPIQTLREVAQIGAQHRGTKHRCLVRVVCHPRNVAQWCSRAEDCRVTGDTGDWIYTVQLRLQDATGELDALIFREDGTTFFQGIPADDLSANPAQLDMLKSAAETLLGDHAWIECCLIGYTRQEPEPFRLYKLFATSLRPDVLGIANREASAQ
ncbi:probable protection of telomeres protein 1 at N-terminal half [Coccomyxa sp. Obi]|nr:probable protection of telomeres protein 1 at N-terminal half [Coccomyxa sp. Obi]